MAINKTEVKEELDYLNEMMKDLKDLNSEAYDDAMKIISSKTLKYYESMFKKTKVDSRPHTEATALAMAIDKQFEEKGALNRIIISALKDIWTENGTKPEISSDELDKLTSTIESIAQHQTAAGQPGKPQTTQNGLPKVDPATPPAQKVKTRQKKKLTFGQKLKKWGRAALRMNPIISQYMDNLDEEDIRRKQKEREDDPTAAGEPGTAGFAASKEILKLLEKIEQNTRGLGDNNNSPNGPAKQSNLSKIKDFFKLGIKNVMSGSDIGRMLTRSYDVVKTTIGGAKELAGGAKDKWNEIGGFKGITEKTKTMMPTFSSWINKATNNTKNITSNAINSTKNWANNKLPTNIFNSTKNMTTKLGSTLSSMNPFKTAEEKIEENNVKSPGDNTEVLKRIEENTRDDKKDKKGGLGGILMNMFNMLKPIFSRLLLMLAPLGMLLLKVAAVLAAFKVGSMIGEKVADGINWIVEKVSSEKGATLGTKTYDLLNNGGKPADQADAKDPAMVKQKEQELKQILKVHKTITPEFAKSLDASGVQYDKNLILSHVSPAATKHTNVPSVIENNSIQKEELNQQIQNKSTAQTMAPIINKPVTNISNSSTTTSIRLHPRNQESTWRNYMEGRYAT